MTGSRDGRGQTTADAVIVGGGVIGCSILYNLATLGMKRLLLLEQGILAGGGSGLSQAICRLHYSNPVTTLMAWHSLKLFQDFEEAVGGPSGYVRTGYLLLAAAEDREALEANVAMQRELGVDTHVLSQSQACEVAPMLDLDDAAGIAYEPQSGYADPSSVAVTYARRAREMGAEVRLSTEVTAIQVVGGRVVGVETPEGVVATPVVVIAAGPWSNSLFDSLGVDLPQKPMRHQVLTLERPPGVLPSHPTVADLINEFSFRPEGGQLTLLSYGEEDCELEGYNPGVEMRLASEALPRLARRCPAFAEATFRGGWAGLFDVTPDWHPILDRVEGIEGLYAATGFSGHGFKLSPMVGVAMAELIARGRSTSVDITPLRWSRFREGALMDSRYRYRVLA